jgi:gamma-glutamylcyclotransferase (GGCT)/AIG2-like uncharacterized protein YtfP
VSLVQVRHYFAYGSNMTARRVASRGMRVRKALSGRLNSYELCFDKASQLHPGEGHANIRFARDCSVEGVVYELLDPREILKMDPFERAPWNYGRDAVAVQTAAGLVWAWTYFANAAVRRADLFPSRPYLAHLLAGEPHLSADYHARLTSWPTSEPVT